MDDTEKIILSSQHELFCQNIVGGFNPTHAYSKAYPKATNNTCRNASCKLMAKQVIKDRIANIREVVAAAMQNSSYLVLTEIRQFLADVVRTPVGKIDRNSKLAQKYEYGVTGLKVWVPDKLSAIKLDCELTGLIKPNEKGSGGAPQVIKLVVPGVMSKPRKA